MIIKIKKWDELNSKSDELRNPNWFRVNQDIGISQSLYDLNSAEKWVWILLLATRCKAKSAEFNVNVGWFCGTFNVLQNDFLNAIKKLNNSGVIQCDCQETVSKLSVDRQDTEHTYIQDIRDIRDETVNEPALPVVPEKTKNPLAGKIWDAYTDAYFSRYGTEPVRNAKVNAQISQLAKRLGHEAPDVVRFYVSHSKSYYVQKAHEIGLCLADAEGLRTQWATGTKITNVQARQTDAAAAVSDQIKRIREGKL